MIDVSAYVQFGVWYLKTKMNFMCINISWNQGSLSNSLRTPLDEDSKSY